MLKAILLILWERILMLKVAFLILEEQTLMPKEINLKHKVEMPMLKVFLLML